MLEQSSEAAVVVAISTLTRQALLEAVGRTCGVGRREAKLLVESVFDAMVKALATGQTIQIRGLGTFKSRARGPRWSRNPRTGIATRVPGKRVIVFKPSRQITHGVADPE